MIDFSHFRSAIVIIKIIMNACEVKINRAVGAPSLQLIKTLSNISIVVVDASKSIIYGFNTVAS